MCFDFDLVFERISPEMKWSLNGKTIAGGHEQGDAVNKLNSPFGFNVDNDETLFIVDTGNHRIMRWKPNATQGEIIAGDKEEGNRLGFFSIRLSESSIFSHTFLK